MLLNMVIKLQKRQFIDIQFTLQEFGPVLKLQISMESNTYCVVLLCCLSSSCESYVSSFSGLSSLFIAPSVFSNVYLASCNMLDTAYDSTQEKRQYNSVDEVKNTCMILQSQLYVRTLSTCTMEMLRTCV